MGLQRALTSATISGPPPQVPEFRMICIHTQTHTRVRSPPATVGLTSVHGQTTTVEIYSTIVWGHQTQRISCADSSIRSPPFCGSRAFAENQRRFQALPTHTLRITRCTPIPLPNSFRYIPRVGVMVKIIVIHLLDDANHGGLTTDSRRPACPTRYHVGLWSR